MSPKDAIAIAKEFEDDTQYLRYPIELAVPQIVEQAIPELPIYSDGLKCEAEPDQCYYICRSLKKIREHCRQSHGWKKVNKRGRVSRSKAAKLEETRPWPWRTVQCQRFFASRTGSAYFEVRDSENNEHQEQQQHIIQPIGLSETEAFAQIVDRGKRLIAEARKSMRRVIGEGEADEPNSWLERTQWIEYLKGLDSKDLMASVREPDEDELVNLAIWNAMDGLIKVTDKVIKTKVGMFVRIEAIRTEKH